MMESKEERFHDLWSDYLEGELDESGVAELHRLMAEDAGLLKLATDTYQTHRLLGVLAGEACPESFVQDTLRRLREADGDFADHVMAQLRPETRPAPGRPLFSRLLQYGGWAIAAGLVAMVFLWDGGGETTTPPTHRVVFSKLARATFFSELTPQVHSTPELNRDYSLVSGSVELTFPQGASTILEAPAVFRVVSADRLALDVGSCSVHAPPGAEGFRVDTPNSRVVDRGTRFFVHVSESSETEVQVVEGAADVYPSDKTTAETLRLMNGDARRIGHAGTTPLAFSPEGYRRGLPDRVISYTAKPGLDGRAQTLTGITVQRGGSEHHYTSAELIRTELLTFHVGPEPHPIGHLVAHERLPARRAELLEDLDLNTGLINPGGSAEPLAGPFDPAQTPGFALRFRQPVINAPGPDVVLFEIQNAVKMPQGDAFHVSPLRWQDRLRSRTVTQFDLMLTSAAALPVSDRHLFLTQDPILALTDLEAAPTLSSPSKLRFSALAVAIDLSDLGYAPGEPVDGLFFQDAMDDANHFDPMVIVGLPAP